MKLMLMAVLGTLLVIGAGPLQAKVELADHQLDQITAGVSVTSQLADNKTVTFQFRKDNGTGGSITGSGSASLDVRPLPGTSGGSISLVNSTANQSGLVNVIAVNSIINALLNLNVNINSNVGIIHQSNTAGALRQTSGIGTLR